MASIDQLQIEIQASSQDAKNAIDNLVKSLKDLNKQLGIKDGTAFARTLGSMARAMDSFTGKMNNFNASKFSETAKGAESAYTSLNRATEQAEKYREALSKISKSDIASVQKGLLERDLAKKTGVDALSVKQEPPLALPMFDKMLPAVLQTQTAVNGVYQSIENIVSDRPQLDAITNSFVEWKNQLSESALGLPMFEKQLPAVGNFDKMLPAVVETRTATDQLYSSIEDVINEGPKLDAVSKAFYDWKSSLLDTARTMEQTGASFDKWKVPEAGANPSFNRESMGWVSDIKPEVVEGYFDEIEDAANKCLPAIRNVGTTALATTDSFKQMETYAKKAYESTAESFEGIKSWDLGTGLEEPLKRLSQNAKYVKSDIERATEAARVFKETINGMESGKVLFDKEKYDEAVQGYEKATETIKNYKNELLGVSDEKSPSGEGDSGANVLTNIVELGEALEKVSGRLDMVAEKGIAMFKFLTIPLRKATEEYREKFSNMIGHVVNFRKNFQAHMKKVSDFWKRTMRTFTFMLVRKAITEIMKEVNNAIQSLAMFSNAMGTQFNQSISLLVADFQYLGRSIVSVFAPLIDFIAPIIDAIVDKIALLLRYIGMLMAALTGASSFTKAKKNVGNYAKSLDGASKSAKNLTMGIDELNILAENSGGGSAKPYDGWEDAWEEVEIPDWIKNLADKIKGMFADLLEPIKKAWEQVKEYFKFAFQYMTDQIVQLAQSIWDAFITVWKQDKTVELFKTLFRIVADLMIVVGNLAKRFREAWDEADRGIKIFEGIRDILLILAEHVRNVTWYMVRWSSELDFSNLLDGVINLLDGLKLLADFIGGVFEDVMKNVVLRYITFLIEEGIPHLLNKIDEVIKKFNFEKIRQDLVPIEEAFERLLVNLDFGKTNAFGNLGEQIAAFTNSEEFSNFTQRIAEIMDLISAEDVEKILTGIGQGIIEIAESLVNFVNSDGFMSFLEFIDKWVKDATSEDIAGVIKSLATAIGIFKFGAFATEKLAGFFKFATVIVALKNLHEIAAGLTAVGEGGAAASGGFAAVASSAATVVAIIAAVIAAVYSLIASFGGLHGLIERVKEAFDRVRETFRLVAEALNMGEHINRLKAHFQGLIVKLGNMKDFWNILLYLVEALAHVFAVVLAPAIDIIITAFDVVIQIVSGVIDVIGGLASAIMGLIEGITTGDWSKLNDSFSRMGEGLVETFIMPFGTIAENVNEAVVGAVKGVGSLFSDEVDTDIKSVDWEKIPAADTAGQGVVNGFTNSYQSAAQQAESTIKATTKTMLSNGTNVIGKVDYAPIADAHTTKMINEMNYSAASLDWASYGTLVNTEVGNSILAQTKPFDDANKTTALEGAQQFGAEYANYFSNNNEIADTLGEFGKTSATELTNSFNDSIELGKDSSNTALLAWFGSIKGTINRQMDQLKAMFSSMLADVFNPKSIDVTTPINNIFKTITDTFTTNINNLGNALLSSILPTFIQTYILPFFNVEMWQPMFDNLLNIVFIPAFERFKTWFDESMLVWWEEHMLTWFTVERWDEDIFTPLAENIHEHFETFSSWWDASMLAWWENQVKPWFEQEKWRTLFEQILEVTEEVFKKINEAIQENIIEATEVVIDSCGEMMEALNEVIEAIGEIVRGIGDLGAFKGKMEFTFGQFASGGFPAYGSLFVAGEPGAGTELVGNIHGRTGVVSNGEITGIEDAVYATGNAESELLSQLISLTRAMLDKEPVVITDKDIARLNNSGQGKIGMSIIS